MINLVNNLYFIQTSFSNLFTHIDDFLWIRMEENLDNNLYFTRTSSFSILLTHIDDFFVTKNSSTILDSSCMVDLIHHFNMKDLGPTKKYDGIKPPCTP